MLAVVVIIPSTHEPMVVTLVVDVTIVVLLVTLFEDVTLEVDMESADVLMDVDVATTLIVDLVVVLVFVEAAKRMEEFKIFYIYFHDSSLYSLPSMPMVSCMADTHDLRSFSKSNWMMIGLEPSVALSCNVITLIRKK